MVSRWRTSDDGQRYWYTARAPKDRPCARCPWLVENHGIVAEQPLEQRGAYLPSTRADLWFTGQRQDGGGIGCAGTDFYNDGSSLADGAWQACHIRRDEKQAQRAYLGSPARPHSLTVCCCSGQRVLAERELLRYIERGPVGSALTAEGAWAYAALVLGRPELTSAEFDALTVGDVLPFTHPSLLDEGIGFERVASVSEFERRKWGARAPFQVKALTAPQ